MRFSGLLWLFGGCLLGVVAGCRPGAEGPLVVYSAGPRPLAEALSKTFTEETGVPVQLFSATTGQIMAKLEAERFNPRADVVILANQEGALALKASGRLMTYRPEGIDATHLEWHDPDHAFHATAAAVVGVASRKGEGPDLGGGWRDVLLRPNRLVMPSPSRSGTAGGFLLAYYQHHPETFWEDFLLARERGLHIVGANSQAITGLLIGAYDSVFAAADYIICREIQKGEPLVVGYPEGGAPYIFRPVALLSSTRRPDAAKAFADHLFSRQSQEKIASQHLLPALPDVPLSPIRAGFPVPPELSFDPVRAMEDQKTLVRKFQYEVERSVVSPKKLGEAQ